MPVREPLADARSVFGGVGTGLYSMLLFVLLAVFIGGLMVGRTPEYLGKKIEAREIKLVVARRARSRRWSCWSTSAAGDRRRKYGAPSIYASGPQGFSETLYAYLSQANNNGSAFAGYTGYVQPNARQPRRPRHHVRRPARRPDDAARALRADRPRAGGRRRAGAQARRARRAWGRCAPTRRRSSCLLIGVVVLVGALTFFPALLLGPVVQGLTTQLF